MKRRSIRLQLAILLTAAASAPLRAGGPDPAPPDESPAGRASRAGDSPWCDNLGDGLADGQKRRRLVLVKAGATWCGWCRKLDAELEQPPLQRELEHWSLVRLDVDRARRDAEKLAVGPIPALRLLRPDGRLLASRDGFLPAAEFAAWLEGARKATDLALDDELARTAPPTAAAVADLVRAFAARDPVTREAAVRRLLPHPDVAAAPVVESLSGGELSVQLSAIELLGAWNAPGQAFDPWRPETITPARIDELRRWAAGKAWQAAAEAATRPAAADVRTEIDALTRAENESQAAAICERLARYRSALLPAVYERLKDAPSDRARERLTTLRYRLVATDARALQWPGGLARLASADVAVRTQAADELAKQAGSADGPLLAELFGDPEPMIREICLRALRTVGGKSAQQSLAQLLGDPDSNVRAAVLKELAVKPDLRLVPRVIEFIGRESDADLIVHAIRVLREAQDDDGVRCLGRLLDHKLWQIRAEAAEALGAMAQRGDRLTDEVKADAYAALIRLLDDSDAFVVSRAFAAIQTGPMSTMLTPERIGKLIEQHPDLAAEATRLLTGRGGWEGDMLARMESLEEGESAYQDMFGRREPLSTAAADLLERLGRTGPPAARCAAIAGLTKALPKRARGLLADALQDADSSVRCAGADALLQQLRLLRPTSQKFTDRADGEIASRASGAKRLESGMDAESDDAVVPDDENPGLAPKGDFVPDDADQPDATGSAPATRAVDSPSADDSRTTSWLADFKAGIDRPKWLAKYPDLLAGLLTAESPEERTRAALPLIALGRDADAMPVLLQAIKADSSHISTAAAALPWLPGGERKALCNALTELNPSAAQRDQIAIRLSISRDATSADLLWRMLDSPDAGVELAMVVQQSLQRVYLGHFNLDSNRSPRGAGLRLVRIASEQARAGPEMRRLVALSLLAVASRDDAKKAAGPIFEDAATPASLRADAFRVLLLSSSSREANKAACAALDDRDPGVRVASLEQLAMNNRIQPQLRDGQFHIPIMSDVQFGVPFNAAGKRKTIEVQPPRGVTVEQVRRFQRDDDSRIRAYAAYLLATLGDRAALDELIAYWRSDASSDDAWTRLVWRAITALNADDRTPVLEEIYGRYDRTDFRVAEFYWTIRGMDGPRVKELRSRMRDEIPAPYLR